MDIEESNNFQKMFNSSMRNFKDASYVTQRSKYICASNANHDQAPCKQ